MKIVFFFLLIFSGIDLFSQTYERNTFYEEGSKKSAYKYKNQDNFEFTHFYRNGKIKETGSFVNGKIDGHWTTFSDLGILTAEAFYEQGKKAGEWRIFDENGNLKYKIQYENNKMLSKANYDLSGNTLSEIRLK